MQLAPGERSILAYFPSTQSAQKAVSELKEAGLETVSLDRTSRYGWEADPEINYPVAGRAASITGPALYASGTPGLTDSERVLLAADPSVSGLGSPNYGLAGGCSFLVTVVTGEDKAEQAVDILKKHGGLV